MISVLDLCKINVWERQKYGNLPHISLIFSGTPEKESNMKKGMFRKFPLVSFFLFISVFPSGCSNDDTQSVSLGEKVVLEQPSLEESTEINENQKIYVYITGQVKNPGVYQVEENARLYIAIEMAGGFTKNASEESLNLAEKVVDGQQINVLSKAEYEKLKKNDSAIAGNSEESSNTYEDTGNKVNINTAATEELMSLPGIGQSKADAIINYRKENGNFSKIEDIMLVPGIKEGAFDKIKLLIKI